MVFPLWLPRGSWSDGWTSRTDTWSALCPFQCKCRQINQNTSKHRFNSNKLGFFVKPVKVTFIVGISGRGLNLVVPHKVAVTNRPLRCFPDPCLQLADHFPTMKGFRTDHCLSVTLKTAITVHFISEFPLVLLCQWHKFVCSWANFPLAVFLVLPATFLQLHHPTFTQKSNSSHWPRRDPV